MPRQPTASPFQFDDAMRRQREPAELEGSHVVGLLCIHGFTGSPYEVRPLADYARERLGWTVHVPLLPGHGEMPERLAGMRWEQWADAARAAYDALAKRCDNVVVAGLSMGGLLALHLAAQESARPASQLRAVFTMAAPAGLFDRRTHVVKALHPLVRWFHPMRFVDLRDAALRRRIHKNFGASINFDNAEHVAALRRIRIPLNAVAQLLRFNDIVLGELPGIRTPVLIAQSHADTVIARDSADVIASRLGSHDKSVVWYERWMHEMPLEDDADIMFAEADLFLSQYAK
jgi:carboxylesterase